MEQHSGCDQVKHLVNQLRRGGNDTVYGLIDWDCQNEPTEWVSVLGYNERYAIENCLLDPLLVAILIVRTERKLSSSLGLNENTTYKDIPKLQPDTLQAVVERIQRSVLGLAESEAMPVSTEVSYAGGLKLSVTHQYLRCPGHELEDKMKKAYPLLNRYQNQGSLLKEVIDPVLFELPELAPQVIISCFTELLRQRSE